jgi:hypothetical protein
VLNALISNLTTFPDDRFNNGIVQTGEPLHDGQIHPIECSLIRACSAAKEFSARVRFGLRGLHF